jgi:hypothetical protein
VAGFGAGADLSVMVRDRGQLSILGWPAALAEVVAGDERTGGD